MSLEDLHRAYREGRLTKPAYIDAMHERHRALHDYARFMKATAVGRIEIVDDRVTFTMRDTGVELIADPKDKRLAPIEALNFGSYEKAEVDAACSLVAPGETFFDIGANVGFYSLTLARRVPGLRIHAFEPIPRTFAALERHLALNGMTTTRAHNFGFSDTAGEKTFYFSPEGSGNASAANLSGAPSVVEIRCRLERLDDFVTRERVAPDLVKCDVEGAELLVFKGGLETLARHRPAILTEMLRKWSAPFGYHPNEIIDTLERMGYGCFTVRGSRLVAFGRMDEGTVETNFFFLHRERHRARIDALASS
jgi:FkbM family methyltransferase